MIGTRRWNRSLSPATVGVIFLCVVSLVVCLANQTSSNANDTSAAVPESNGSLSLAEETSGRGVSPVKVAVYYETYCPDSVAFIYEQLKPTFTAIGSIMSIELIPYGKASYKASGDSWTFQCQHGKNECEGNEIHACAINAYPDISRSLPFVACTMTKNPITSAKSCATDNGLNYQTISDCSSGALGAQLLHANGVKTETLFPKLTFVPWIVLNDEFTSTNQEKALYNLKGLVCDLYKGKRPVDCWE